MCICITSLLLYFFYHPPHPPPLPAPPSAPPQLFCFTLWLAPYLPCPSPCPAPCRCLPEQGGDEAQHLSSVEAGLPAVLWWAPWFCGHVCATGPIANTECSTQGRLGEGGGECRHCVVCMLYMSAVWCVGVHACVITLLSLPFRCVTSTQAHWTRRMRWQSQCSRVTLR